MERCRDCGTATGPFRYGSGGPWCDPCDTTNFALWIAKNPEEYKRLCERDEASKVWMRRAMAQLERIYAPKARA